MSFIEFTSTEKSLGVFSPPCTDSKSPGVSFMCYAKQSQAKENGTWLDDIPGSSEQPQHSSSNVTNNHQEKINRHAFFSPHKHQPIECPGNAQHVACMYMCMYMYTYMYTYMYIHVAVGKITFCV